VSAARAYPDVPAMKHVATFVPAVCALVLAGCAEDLEFQPYVEPAVVEPVATEDNGDETFTTRVLAEDGDVWVYFDFQSGAQVTPATPEDSADWDLAFSRFHIKTNGGISGSGASEVAVLPDGDFDGLAQAPDGGYLEDSDDGDDDNSEPDYVFELDDGWYAYDPASHTLTPRPLVYVVLTPEGDYFKLEMLGYYDAAGSDARPSFRWAPLAAPSAAQGS
jgi:heme-binding HmuY-like protein